jgi:hypothetical protein
MAMKKILPLILVAAMVSCHDGKKIPDVSGIPVTVKIERFDKAFFSLDTNQVNVGLYQLNHEFPYFTTDFLVNILGAGIPSDSNQTAFVAARQFLISYLPVRDSISRSFDDLSWLEKELQKSFRFVKYYFPKYQLPPKVVSFIGPFDAPGVAITRYTLAIGLQLYAGKNFSFYNSPQGHDMYPAYISRRFEPAYIMPNCIKAMEEDLYPDNSGSKPLILQMVEKGKYWWLLDKFLPETPDSLKTGFTQKQLDWCKSNEGLIWNFFLQSDLFTIDPDLIKNYLGDAPNTQGMPGASPGNIGQWVGLQIVKKYENDNPGITPEQLMQTDSKKIFEEAKYKPK